MSFVEWSLDVLPAQLGPPCISSKAFRLMVPEGRCGPRRSPFSSWQDDKEKVHLANVRTMRKKSGLTPLSPCLFFVRLNVVQLEFSWSC